MNVRLFFSPLVCFLALSSWLGATVVPGRWEKVEALPLDSRILLRISTGESMECTFKALDEGALTVVVGNGVTLTIPRADIVKIAQYRWHHSGPTPRALFIGALAGALTGTVASRSFEGSFSSRSGMMALACGASGAAIGAAISWARTERSEEVLFLAP
jgi:hypothetical protein